MTDVIVSMMFADIGGLLLLPFGLLALGFWLWMIVDCAKHEDEGSTKIFWVLVILFASVLGAPLYFIVRRLPRKKRGGYQATLPVYQPWNKEKRIG